MVETAKKLLILGATGKAGRRLLPMALDRGHDVTAFVRNESLLNEQLKGHRPENLSVITGDASDPSVVSEAIQDNEIVINAAGNAAKPPGFVEIVNSVIEACEECLGEGGRLWLFGGAAALDVPETNIMTVDLPKVPVAYNDHKTNYLRVRETTLDWSMLCVGPMTAAPDGRARDKLNLSTDVWPTAPLSPLTTKLPPIVMSLAFKRRIPKMTVSYEDAAKTILNHLDTAGPFSRKRVGIGLAD